MLAEQAVSKFILIGNHACLDFINTQIIQNGRLVELLESFSDLAAWLAAVQVIERVKAEELARRWGGTAEGRKTLERALAFRLVLRKMIEGIVKGEAVAEAAVAEINELLRHRVRYPYLRYTQEGFQTVSRLEFDAAFQLLTPLAEAAAGLLCHADFSLIKKCENPDCILYFYDTSKNHARRWCSMSLCGNRLKVAAYYRRRRGQ
jgi:predicted RNA-binding Zn ribbon-like protein